MTISLKTFDKFLKELQNVVICVQKILDITDPPS